MLKVTDKESHPLSKVKICFIYLKKFKKIYVKVFSKNKSEVGYTDIRGRFDYESLNNNTLSEIGQF